MKWIKIGLPSAQNPSFLSQLHTIAPKLHQETSTKSTDLAARFRINLKFPPYSLQSKNLSSVFFHLIIKWEVVHCVHCLHKFHPACTQIAYKIC